MMCGSVVAHHFGTRMTMKNTENTLFCHFLSKVVE